MHFNLPKIIVVCLFRVNKHATIILCALLFLFLRQIFHIIIMAKTKDEAQQQAAAAPEQVAEAPATPNRDAYKAAFAEDYPDADFEDKEDRYSRMLDDRQTLRDYRTNGKKLSEAFEKNRWLAAMFQDLARNDDPEYTPLDWMAEHGINPIEAMEDDNIRKKLSKKIADYQAQQVEGEKTEKERDENLAASVEALKSVVPDDEQAGQIWNDFFQNIIDPALHGEVSTETWQLMLKAKNYDSDIQTAGEEAGMKARNEKIANKVKKFDTPPTLPQGAPAAAPNGKKGKSEFWDDLRE